MDSQPEVIDLSAGPALSIRAQVPLSGLPTFFGPAFAELVACAGDQIAGAPFARYHAFDPASIDLEAVIPVKTEVPVSGRVQAITLEGGPAVQVRHVGTYEDLGATYLSIERWLEDHHAGRKDFVREVYMTEPTVPAAEHVTIVIQPLQAAP